MELEAAMSFKLCSSFNRHLTPPPAATSFINRDNPSKALPVPISGNPFPNASVRTRRNFKCKASNNSRSIKVADEVKMAAAEFSDDLELSSLTALCPLDGRYWEKVKGLVPYLSEYGLIRYRVLVEVMWLLKLSLIPEIPEVPKFSNDAETFLENLFYEFSLNDAKEVKKIEKVTNHDVKAVEYFLKKKCQSHPEITKVLEFFHFACTSEDINNLAHALMLKEALNRAILPAMDEVISKISKMALENASIPMLSRTHGQPASPTTLGKEMAIFAYRLNSLRGSVSNVKILGKFAGAVGNYNAHLVAYPDIVWPRIAEDFVTSLGIGFNPYVPQIEPHDYMAELFRSIILFNNILLDFNRDIWGYISLGYFKQRDLTDSTVLRNMGVGLGHSLVAYKNALQGIAKLQVNEARLSEDLNSCWEVLAEPIQTEMRRYGVPEPYEKLKELTRGRSVTQESIREFINCLDIPVDAKTALLNLTPHTYVGAGPALAQNIELALHLVNGRSVH